MDERQECPFCGAILDDGDESCEECGANLED
ncbi:zinc-ribbon domain-containing protein [Candidatus Woesearchaeota archaeon]|nr:zinc-ribbon domain-containing protein [Candidatus Woesearchaeota archaeon]